MLEFNIISKKTLFHCATFISFCHLNKYYLLFKIIHMSRHFVNFLLLALVGGFFYLTSCSKSDLISNQLTTEETQINAALENAEDNNLLPGTTLEIRGGGDVVDPDSLPQTIIDYVDLNYPDSVSITKALHLKMANTQSESATGKFYCLMKMVNLSRKFLHVVITKVIMEIHEIPLIVTV